VSIKHIFNCVKSPPDPRHFLFTEKRYTSEKNTLPSSVDLRAQCSPVVDQLDLGSCTANALASGLREFLLLKAGKPLTRLSRLFLYYEERSVEGTIKEDSGACLKDGLDCMLHLGVCREDLDPYDISTFENPPSPVAVTEAVDFKISKYMSVVSLNAAKACLAQGYPVVIGMQVFDQMESDQAAQTGIVSVPPLGAESLGGHAVTLVGYTDTPKFQPGYWKGGGWLWLKNSWGSDWGLNGFFKIAYAYANQYVDEYWTAR